MAHFLDSLIPQRYWAWALTIVLAVACFAVQPLSDLWLWPALAFSALALVGLLDFTQTRQAIRRNYPVLSHLRFFFEFVRPEIRQYFLETDTEELPFSRAQRSIVYQRAKNVVDKWPFGTQLSLYETHYEWINHSIAPTEIDSHDFRVMIGGPQCLKPYEASVFNISAMSFGALSANAVLALNEGAKRGRFYQDTGEGSISRYHRERGGDLTWEIGSGYFGCRDAEGRFDERKFAENAAAEQVKMIEIKLSQGAKPGHGGVLPAAKVTAEIAAARGVPVGVDCISPARHSAFDTPLELIGFVARLRDRIRIGASGKIVTAFDIARTIAMGADWCNSARGFMFALGCIQSQSCHSGYCPTGVATQDPRRMRALVVPDKAERVYRFHRNTLKALKELLAAAGLSHPRELGPEHVIRRVSSTEVRSLAALHQWVAPGELLGGVADHPAFKVFWPGASAEGFAAPANVLSMRGSKDR